MNPRLKNLPKSLRRTRGLLLLCAMAAGTYAGLMPAMSAEALAPQTRLRVNVVQWIPMKGAYEQWSALGGEFTVSDQGTVTLPVIGTVPVGDGDEAKLASEISRLLQARLGTVEKPDTTVEVVEFPPVYVVGDVQTPGTYGFRAGLTVLQALALAGGELRSDANRSRDQISLVGDLRALENDILRGTVRIARLRAEIAGESKIDLPSLPHDSASRALAADIVAQEKAIIKARAGELERQEKSLGELRDLLGAEIKVLEQKISDSDAGLAATEKELAGVTVLVEKGIAIASRQTDLERSLAGFRADRLDQVTAVMRARQGIAEATRNLDGLRDRHQTEIALELQREQANLDQALLKRDTSQKLLLDLLASAPAGNGPDAVSFAIIREENGEVMEKPAVETTVLRPRDVVRVTLAVPPVGASDQTSAVEPPPSPPRLSEATQ